MFNPAQYPRFKGADVFILAPTGATWNLFSTTLATTSIIFSEFLSIHPPGHITPKQRDEGKTIKWRFHMKPDAKGRFVKFEFVSPAAAKQALFDFTPFDHQVPVHYLHIYDNLFRCMCNIDPVLMAGDKALVDDTLDLLHAAEGLHAVPCVRRDIETHLLRTGAYLWQRVLQDVENWADIGIRLRSPVIFRESMIRIVGLWNVPSAIKKKELLDKANGVKLYDMVEKKIKQQTQRKIEIEEQLRTFFPRAMLHPPSNNPNVSTPGRAFYANDVYYWHALTLVREYIVREILAGHGHAASDGGCMFYNTIGNGGGSYCRAGDLEEWHENFDMTAKGKQRLRDSLNIVKEEMKTVVAELMVCRSNIAPLEGDYPYLMHTEFTDEELPWYTAPIFGINQPAPPIGVDNDEDEDDDGLFVPQGPTLPAPGNPMPPAQMVPSANLAPSSSPLSSPSNSEGAGSFSFGHDQVGSGPSGPNHFMGPEDPQDAAKRRKLN